MIQIFLFPVSASNLARRAAPSRSKSSDLAPYSSLDAGAPPRAPGDFLTKRKSPKIRQEPPGSWTSGEGGVAPFDPPALCPSGIGRGNLNPQASSGASHLPRHGLTAEGVTPGRAWGEIKTDLPTSLKWQIGLVLWHKPYRGGAGTAGGAKHPPRGSRGTPLARLW